MTASGVVVFVLVLAGCALLWPAGRRLGLTPLGVAVAVGAAVLVAVPVAAAGAAGPSGPALLCVMLGVLIVGSDPGSKVAAGGLALAAVLNAPVVAVALLVGLTLLVASPGSGPEMSRLGRAGVHAAGIGAALVVAVMATGSRAWALATPTGGVGATVAAALVLACAVGLTGLVWLRLPWLRPVAAAAAAQAACALVPGTSVAVLVLVAPLLGVLAAVALTEIVLPGRSRHAGAAVVGAVLVSSAAALLGSGPAQDGPAPTTTAVASSAVADAARAGVRPVRIPALVGPAPAPELRLVTCGGSVDRSVQSYRDGVVVEAVRA